MIRLKTKDPKYPVNSKLLDIVIYPDPVLKAVAKPITEFNSQLEAICLDMLKTMYHAPGIGLAAPQVGISQRIFVLDVNYERKKLKKNEEDEDEEVDDDDDELEVEIFNLNPQIFINPILTDLHGTTSYNEGCLSLPGVYDDVERFKTLTINYQDLTGQHQCMKADDLLSICIQHETDHLDGILFIEKLSRLKFDFYKKKLIKDKKNHKR